MRILIPFDGSAKAREVLPYVAELFSPQDTALSFLRVMDTRLKSAAPASLHNWATLMKDLLMSDSPENHAVYKSPFCDAFQDELKVALEPNLRIIRDAAFQVDLVLRYGDPITEIQLQIDQADVDLVVMATRGHMGLKGKILGSVAKALLKKASTPLMLFRPEVVHAPASLSRP